MVEISSGGKTKEQKAKARRSYNLWKWLFFLVLIAGLAIAGRYGWNRWNIFNTSNDIKDLQAQITTETASFDALSENARYKRYKAAEYLQKENPPHERAETIEYLITFFDNLRTLSANSDDIALEDITIDVDGMTLRGTVRELRSIYASGQLLDKLQELDFIEHLDIPSYTESEDGFEFDLKATIKPNENDGPEQQ